jgi:hypothetical protein
MTPLQPVNEPFQQKQREPPIESRNPGSRERPPTADSGVAQGSNQAFPPRKSTVKAEGSAYNDGFGYYSETVQFEDVPGKCKWPVRVGSTCRVTNVDLFFGIAPLWVQVELGQLSLREKWSWKPGAAAGFAAVFDGKIIRPLELDGP